MDFLDYWYGIHCAVSLAGLIFEYVCDQGINWVVFLCWIAGDAQIGLNVTALDPLTVASEVWYGKESGKYSTKRTGVSMVYNQLYPFEGLWNYTSGIIHHVRIDGKS